MTKRAHVTRFAGARLLDDTIAWTGASVGDPLAIKLEARLDGDQVTVALPSRARPGHALPHWPGDDREDLKLTRREQILALAFDAAAGEGVVVARDGERLLVRLFDASGQPVGEPIVTIARGRIEDVARIGGKWMGIGGIPMSLLNLTDRTGPFSLPEKRTFAGHLFVTGQGGAVLSMEGRTLVSFAIGPGGVTGPAEPIATLPPRSYPGILPLALAGSTRVAYIEPREQQEGPDRLVWRGLTPGSDWQYTELPGHEPLHPHSTDLRRVHGDVVITSRYPSGPRTFTWVQAGKSVTLEVQAGKASGTRLEQSKGGPLLDGGLRLPSGPGLPVADEAIARTGQACLHSVATGPNTIVLACVHATDPVVPGLRVALRTLTVDPPR